MRNATMTTEQIPDAQSKRDEHWANISVFLKQTEWNECPK